jgi:hypothetical protein
MTNVLGIGDPDAPVFRIFPLWFFEEALRLRELVLVLPEQWEDPYEVLTSRIMIVRQRTAPTHQQPLAPFLLPAYAQCWSNTSESDTLLRAYSRVAKDSRFGRNASPRDEGVTVRSTARKLLEALRSWSPSHADTSCFIGAVQYGDGDQIQQELTNRIDRYGPEGLRDGRPRADLLLFKRKAFQHEAEVRLVYIEGRDIPAPPDVRVPIDPNDVFDEVTFDPRLGGLSGPRGLGTMLGERFSSGRLDTLITRRVAVEALRTIEVRPQGLSHRRRCVHVQTCAW